jgi:hypothetical protein
VQAWFDVIVHRHDVTGLDARLIGKRRSLPVGQVGDDDGEQARDHGSEDAQRRQRVAYEGNVEVQQRLEAGPVGDPGLGGRPSSGIG